MRKEEIDTSKMLQINKSYRLGQRGIKTAIGVCVCALISMFLRHEDIFCACIASVICMEQTFAQTKDTGIHRVIGTMIGGIIGYVFLELCYITPYYEWARVVALPICILLVVYLCNVINRKASVSIGCVVVIVILSRSVDNVGSTFTYVLQRVCDTLIGIAVAMVINKLNFRKIFNIKNKNSNNFDNSGD